MERECPKCTSEEEQIYLEPSTAILQLGSPCSPHAVRESKIRSYECKKCGYEEDEEGEILWQPKQ